MGVSDGFEYRVPFELQVLGAVKVELRIPPHSVQLLMKPAWDAKLLYSIKRGGFESQLPPIL